MHNVRAGGDLKAGSAGEEYYGWNPLGKSPRITLHTKSGKEIVEAYFAGSC